MSQHTNFSPFILTLVMVFLVASACSPQPGGSALTDQTWQWATLSETQPAAQSVVPNPEAYTLMLGSDGTLNIQADCNMVSGSYTLDEEFLTIELGPSTMAFCGEQSLDIQFLDLLAAVERFTIENDQLILHLENDAGSMRFTK